jgi:hypothetical protein
MSASSSGALIERGDVHAEAMRHKGHQNTTPRAGSSAGQCYTRHHSKCEQCTCAAELIEQGWLSLLE